MAKNPKNNIEACLLGHAEQALTCWNRHPLYTYLVLNFFDKGIFDLRVCLANMSLDLFW